MPKAAPKTFRLETDLCAAFLALVPVGWTAFAETGGWDILLVRASDGFQIGIQAKLRFNVDVINQALERGYDVTRAGPDCRAVLIPHGCSGGLGLVCDYVGITVITMDAPSIRRPRGEFRPRLPDGQNDHNWHEQCPTKRHILPEYVPDVAAGSRAPVQLTKWKIAAIKIAITMEHRGYATREDFRRYGIDHRRWVPQGWMTAQGGMMRKGPDLPDFQKQHPRVYAEIAAAASEWMPKTLL